ncbi:WD40-repeat-containing domain protein [Gorgonomyces haynaldii]|nr:WD40-repeat-containing domain protein [Gorgonomyces haynaldii]
MQLRNDTLISDSSISILQKPKFLTRYIQRTPYKVLDAPELQDDFYLNLVDWSSTNFLGVGLGSCVYLWNASTSRVNKLCDVGPNDTITSVNWSPKGNMIAVGTHSGTVQLWDCNKTKKIRDIRGHKARVGALAWNGNVLTSGGRDRTIYCRDMNDPTDYTHKFSAHRQEVCGLKWNPEDSLLASGGNDNKLYVWDPKMTRQLWSLNEHKAAVKAITWSPHQHGLLASGGGTADRCIRFWNVTNGQQMGYTDTGSQVCNIAWSKNSNELVSTHGYSHQNQIFIWRYKTMEPICSLTGHTFRVLYLAMSPDGQHIVTGAGDETLRFWTVFNKSQHKREHQMLSVR